MPSVEPALKSAALMKQTIPAQNDLQLSKAPGAAKRTSDTRNYASYA